MIASSSYTAARPGGDSHDPSSTHVQSLMDSVIPMYFSTTDDSIELQKIQDDLAYLHECMIRVLGELGQEPVVRYLESEDAGKPEPQTASKAFSLYFQFVHLVEENTAVQLRRKLENEHGLQRISGLWGRTLGELKAAGLSPEQIAERLPEIRIEPVFTAHPTESKRSTVIEQLRTIYLAMVRRENPIWTDSEREQIAEDIQAAMQRLWFTGQVFLQKPTLSDELGNVLHYLRNILPNVLILLDRRLREAWAQAGFDPHLIAEHKSLPQVRFGNWVGGDRDGHPFVTDQVTQETLIELRTNALVMLRKELSNLARRLSVSSHESHVPVSLYERMETLANRAGADAENAKKRNPGEPFRQFLNLMKVLLPIDGEDRPLQHPDADRHYATEDDVLADLDLLKKALQAIGAHRIAFEDVEPVARKVATFGFHMATLDVRQNSGFHDKAMSQLLQAAGIEDGEHFAQWSESRRLAFLESELRTPRPFVRRRQGIGPEADAVLALLPGACPAYRALYQPRPRRTDREHDTQHLRSTDRLHFGSRGGIDGPENGGHGVRAACRTAAGNDRRFEKRAGHSRRVYATSRYTAKRRAIAGQAQWRCCPTGDDRLQRQ
jgi:phosphoenolpyruvate carboxylase